jgi:hypothetical protein
MGCKVSLQVHPMPVPETTAVALEETGEESEDSIDLEMFLPNLKDLEMLAKSPKLAYK